MAPDRRMFLGATVGVTAAVANGLMMAASADPDDTPFPDGSVSRNPGALTAAAHDFGGLVQRRPHALVRPGASA